MVIRLTPVQLSRFGGFAYEAPLPEFRRFEEYNGPNLVPSPILDPRKNGRKYWAVLPQQQKAD